MTPITIVRWDCKAEPDLTLLRRAAGTEGHAFVECTHREWLDGSNRFDQAEHSISSQHTA